MSLFNIVKEKIPTPIKNIDKEIIEDREREFGSLSEEELLEQKKLLNRQIDDISSKLIVENTRVIKESKGDNDKKIQEVLTSIEKSNI